MLNSKIEIVGKDRLKHIADRAAHWRRPGQSGRYVPTSPPDVVIADMLAQRPIPLDEIKAVVEAPFFSPSGRLVSTNGYDRETKRYLQLPESLTNLVINPHPSDEDVRGAVALIEDWLCDFPFASEADFANALAKVLDPFTRTIYDGLTPAYIFSAPSAGTGKGLLVDVLTIPSTGEGVATESFVPGEAELKKLLLAKIIEGTAHIHFDNFEGILKSGTLSSFLTSHTYSGRLLSYNKTVAGPQRVNVSFSGNNVVFGGDIGRRVVLIRLDARVAHPESRSVWTHPEILQWTKDNRRAIVEAILTLVQSWVAAGMRPGSVTKGSYEPWAQRASGILEHVGISGFLANHDEIADADTEGAGWEQFVSLWWNEFQGRDVTPSQLVRLVDELDQPPFYIPDAATPRSLSISLGKHLLKLKDRVFDTCVVRRAGKSASTGSTYWRLERLAVTAVKDTDVV